MTFTCFMAEISLFKIWIQIYIKTFKNIFACIQVKPKILIHRKFYYFIIFILLYNNTIKCVYASTAGLDPDSTFADFC